VRRLFLTCVVVFLACGAEPDQDLDTSQPAPPEHEPPVMTNGNSPVEYPLELFERGQEGTVVLRLYVDQRGILVPESTAVAESSGYAALDSAALAGTAGMLFAPARRRGVAIDAAFFQPVHFRIPEAPNIGDSR